MEQKKHTCASICDDLPTLFANHPWWLVQYQMLENENRNYIVYTTRDPPSQHRYRIPSSLGRLIRIRGCFHGWVILSSHPYNDIWSLWNPMTSKIIGLPRLISENNEDLECCLTSPPDDHGSIFMLTSTKKHTIVFCRLDCRRERYEWVEMSYAKQMRSIVGYDDFLRNPTCCNGKVYALNSAWGRNKCIILVDIAVKGREIVISLLSYLNTVPVFYDDGCSYTAPFLKGCCNELLYVKLRVFNGAEKKVVGGVFVLKLDTENRRWEIMEDLKGASIFLDLSQGGSIFYCPAIGPESGGYAHILGRTMKYIHSYDFKNKTVALSSMPMHYPSSLERRLQQEEDIINNGNKTTIEEGNMESHLLNIPFDVLKTIIEFCVGVEYLNLRSICKKCHLAAPMIRWSKGGRLQTYSLVSPWLMVLDKDRGVITFTDPMFGDKYFIKTPHELIGNVQIHCSMYGWLLVRRFNGLVKGLPMFFNPFTSDIRELPDAPFLDTYCFSAPPTSSDCMVVGFKSWGEWHVYVHLVGQEPSWRKFRLQKFSGDISISTSHFAIPYARNLYAFYNNGGLEFIDIDNEHYSWRKDLAKGSIRFESRNQNFVMKCDQQLLQVVMGEFGQCVEVFKLNNDSTEWEKTESLGRHAIYICGKSCICMEAKMPTMANKIYFPRIHSENQKIVFYSLETRRYHTSNVEESLVDLVGTTYHINPNVWIEPSWS